jgi:serine/threonine protein kinase/tetratricopeptide (TPR) repeat protein
MVMQEQSIFIEALEQEGPAQRAAFLDRTCAGDPGLRRRIERLLQRHEQADGFLESPALGRLPAEQPSREGPGTVIGPYELREQIGEGGFGVVFRAEQQQPLRRTVALKVLKPGMDSRRVIARFQAERQVLALMEHPNIARVLDAGLTESGRPWFVMELVPGVPITGYCDLHELTIRDRLELFVSVCSAVQHAHQKGIIHRDLKPSNVLVTQQDGAAVVKVIDFGIAKAVGQPLTEQALDSGSVQMIGTPLYMSPEQARGGCLDIDTRSDIYSLGVLLYELLTGTTPFDKARLCLVGYDELRRIIREEEPPPPSTRITTLDQAATVSAQRQGDTRGLSRLFRGELDQVVMKALEKDRERRYETSGALGADVQRYLSGEPVQAYPPSAGYRLRKWAGRHRTAMTAAAAVLLVGLTAWAVSTVLILRQRDEARAQRELAQQQRTLADKQRELALRAVDEMYTDVAEQWLDREPHLHEAQRRFLVNALNYYQAFTAEPATEPGLRHQAGIAYRRVGNIQSRLGRPVEAEAAYRQAVALQGELADAFPDWPVYRQDLALSQDNLGSLLTKVGRLTEAEQAHRRALPLWERLTADFPTEPRYRAGLSWSRTRLGTMLAATDRPREAERAFRQAIDCLEELAARAPAIPSYRHQLGVSLKDLGSLLADQGRRGEAEQALRRAVVLEEELVAKYPAVTLYRYHLARMNDVLAIFLRSSGRPAEAEQTWRRALTLAERLAADYPGVIDYRAEVARGHTNLALVLKSSGRLEQAEQAMRRALTLYDGLARESPALPRFRHEAAQCQINLGNLLRQTGRPAGAVRAYRQAVSLLEPLVAGAAVGTEYRLHLAHGQTNLAVLLEEIGRPGEAELAFRQAVTSWEKVVAEYQQTGYQNGLALCLCHLGDLLRQAGRADEAAQACRQALGWARQAVELAPGNAGCWNTLGVAQYRTGQWQSARGALSRSIQLRRGDSASWFYLALIHERLGEKDQARQCYDRACAGMAKDRPGDHRLRALRSEAAALLGLPPPGEPPREAAFPPGKQ